MNDMKKDRLKFRTIGAYMSVVYVLRDRRKFCVIDEI